MVDKHSFYVIMYLLHWAKDAQNAANPCGEIRHNVQKEVQSDGSYS